MDVNRTVFATFAPVEICMVAQRAAGAHFLNLDTCPRSGTRSNGNHCSQVDEAPSNA
jgi:hypothetical protein